MKYQVGDKVLLLHSREEGEVIEILGKDMVTVEVQGVRFPVYMDQIDFPYFHRFTEKKLALPKKEKVYIDSVKKDKSYQKYKVGQGVWFTFLPVYDKEILDEDIVECFKVYLVNQTESAYRFHYSLSFSGSPEFFLDNEIRPLSEFYLHDIPFEDMNDNPRLACTFVLSEKMKGKVDELKTEFRVRARQLFRNLEEIQKKNEPTFSHLLFKEYPDKAPDLKPEYSAAAAKFSRSLISPRALPAARSVIDLHIEKLSDDYKNLSNYEILTLQLREFEKYYDLALAHHQPGLIVVHGLGTGKLREEIHEILKLKPEVKSFVNQYHPSYGYGATEIFFQY